MSSRDARREASRERRTSSATSSSLYQCLAPPSLTFELLAMPGAAGAIHVTFPSSTSPLWTMYSGPFVCSCRFALTAISVAGPSSSESESELKLAQRSSSSSSSSSSESDIAQNIFYLLALGLRRLERAVEGES